MNPEKIEKINKISKISYDDFAKVEIRAGKILSAEKITDTDKLLKLSVDVGEIDPLGKSTLRQIISGIALHFPDPTVLVGKTCMFVTNLEPRTIREHVSDGMLFAVSTAEGIFSILEPVPGISPGTRAK
jgi:methionyl-tRNA synthetase